MKPSSCNWKTKLRFLEHGTPTYQTSHAHKRCSTKIKHLPWTSNYWVWSAPRASFPQWSQKGPLHFIIIWKKNKRFLYISKDWLIHFNVWRQNRRKRCQSWNVLPWKHSSLKGNECSAEQEETPEKYSKKGTKRSPCLHTHATILQINSSSLRCPGRLLPCTVWQTMT